jgi:hypothetical protein
MLLWREDVLVWHRGEGSNGIGEKFHGDKWSFLIKKEGVFSFFKHNSFGGDYIKSEERYLRGRFIN